MKNLYKNLTDEEQMAIDFAMMREDGTYDILFPEPTDDDLEKMFQEHLENLGMTEQEYNQMCEEETEDFFVPEAEDYAKYEKEMGEIPF